MTKSMESRKKLTFGPSKTLKIIQSLENTKPESMESRFEKFKKEIKANSYMAKNHEDNEFVIKDFRAVEIAHDLLEANDKKWRARIEGSIIKLNEDSSSILFNLFQFDIS